MALTQLGSAIVLCLIGWLVLATRAAAADACEEAVGYIVSIQGTVQILHGPAGEWRAAFLNEALCDETVVQVGDRSRAEVALIDQSKYRIDQNSTLRLVQVRRDAPSLLNLITGAAYFFSRQPRVLQIDTPFVNAAVEGTEFLVSVHADRTLLTVFEGKVAASNDQGRVLVASGDSALTRAGEAPQPYLLVRPRDAVQWALYYPYILFPLADPSGAAAQQLPDALVGPVALASRGDYAGAFAAFDAVPEAERGADFYIYRAGTLLAVGRVDEATADIDRALAVDPSSTLAYALRAVIAVAQNDEARALEDARRAVELGPRSAAAQIALSYAQQAQFQIEAARDTLKQAVEDEPENALAWARLSEVWLALGERRRSLKAAKRARDLAPDLGLAQTAFGFAQLAELRPERAKKAFEKAVALNSADPLARLGLGLAQIRQGDLAEGRGEIELAVGLDPQNAMLRSYLGKAYFEERDPSLAGDEFATAKALDPNDPTPYLYDAILKQSENRPVEALRDAEKSIELNDNRAIYRSRLLLDADNAGRGASLARIYDDLGFQQLAINQAAQSLSLDPANSAAHRFLTDTYATLPRRQVAQVSELLQAQLLQDININPVQPSIRGTSLNVFTGGGPARIGLNEYTPLFERNRAQLNVSGEVGNQSTYADEAVVSGVYDRLSLSAGQYHYSSDGFRENFDLNQNIYDVFAQAAITPELNVQGEFRSRRLENGDRNLNFEPPSFTPDPTFVRNLDENTARLGARFSPSSRSDFLASLIYNDLHIKQESANETTSNVEPKGLQYETAYLLRRENFNGIAGIGVYHVDRSNLLGSTHANLAQQLAYIYSNFTFPNNTAWTIGLSYDHYDQSAFSGQDDKLEISQINPKIGLQWNISDNILLRGAIFRSLKQALVTNGTIEPTQVAGFNQFFDDFNGTQSWTYGIGLDARLSQSLYSGAEFFARELDVPYTSEGKWFEQGWSEKNYRAYLYWTPLYQLAVTGNVVFEMFDNNLKSGFPSEVNIRMFPVSVRYFDKLGLFADASLSFIHENVDRRAKDLNANEGNQNFWLVNADVGYRLPYRRGLVGLQVANLFNERFRFQDDNFRNSTGDSFSAAIIPERAILFNVNLNF